MNALVMGDGSDAAQACAERLREDGMTVVLTTADRSVQDAAELGRSGLDVLVTSRSCASMDRSRERPRLSSESCWR